MTRTIIRNAVESDRKRIRAICFDAFDKAENEAVANLACDLLTEGSTPPTINLAAETDGDLVGNVAFSPVWRQLDKALAGYILAPLAVSPAWQNRGVGSTLVREGLRQVERLGARVALVYGDPAYYARFGFAIGPAERFEAPYPLKYPNGWQAMELNGGPASGFGGPIECVKALSRPELW